MGEEYLLARVHSRSEEQQDWWYDSSIRDKKRDVSFRLDVELLPDSEQPSGMGGYKLHTIRWARVEYRVMRERNSGSPPINFFDLEPNDLIRILTLPAAREEIMLEVCPPAFFLMGHYHKCEIQRVKESSQQHDSGLRLRARPARVSHDTVKDMIWEKGFHHPNPDGMPPFGGIIGTFQPRYEAKTLNGGEVVIEHKTSLMWQRSGSDRMNWEEAPQYIDQLNRERYAGHPDWRLPTIEELISLLGPTKKSENRRLYVAPEFDVSQWGSWSSDRTEEIDVPYGIDFHHGVITTFTTVKEVRVVRSL